MMLYRFFLQSHIEDKCPLTQNKINRRKLHIAFSFAPYLILRTRNIYIIKLKFDLETANSTHPSWQSNMVTILFLSHSLDDYPSGFVQPATMWWCASSKFQSIAYNFCSNKMFPESSHEIYFLGVRSNGITIQLGILLFLLAWLQRLREETCTFAGIQLSLSAGYKCTSKNPEKRRFLDNRRN